MAWSVQNLVAEHGRAALDRFSNAFPHLSSIRYDPATLDLNSALAGADLVLVHEWNDHDLVARIGRHRAQRGEYRLLFHDTHHRAVSEPESMASYDLSGYDGVLAFGSVIRDLYRHRGWAKEAWTWHEAADTRTFSPRADVARQGGLVWIGNWGDGERTAELHEFLLEPVRALGLKARVYGVRYPAEARAALAAADIEYGGWTPNDLAPEIFAAYQVTVHVPRRPYVHALPGIPTIRIFEALACGIPLVSAPWDDREGLFSAGEDFLFVQNGEEMRTALRTLLNEPEYAQALASHGRETILQRHTCGHRVDELMAIYRSIGGENMTAITKVQEVAAS